MSSFDEQQQLAIQELRRMARLYALRGYEDKALELTALAERMEAQQHSAPVIDLEAYRESIDARDGEA